MTTNVRSRRLRFAPLAVVVGLVSSATLGLSVTGTLSGFTSSITNDTNTASSGSLTMKETNDAGSVTCLSTSGTNNAATCSTIDKYGAATLTPGNAASPVVVRIYNTGAQDVNGFTLTPGTCAKTTGSGTGNLCGALTLTLTCQASTGGATTTLINGVALNALSASYDIKTAAATCVPPRSPTNHVKFTFTVAMASGTDNTLQDITIKQPLTWTFTGA